MGEFSERQKEIVNYLRELGREEREVPEVARGICGNLLDEYEYEVRSSVFAMWPKFSGDRRFPVPSTDSSLTAEQMFSVFSDAEDLWTGEYGQLRKDLCLWLADYYEKNGI